MIACDSRQVYVGLDIGTGKYPNLNIKYQKSKIKKRKGYWVIDGILIHMYDLVSPKRQYTVADYVKDTEGVIRDIVKRGKLPILVGGTGLYERAIVDGLSSLKIPADKKLRNKLIKLSREQLQRKLEKIDQEKWEGMNNSDKNNQRRLIRAIELAISTHKGGLSTYPTDVGLIQDVLKVGLTASRDILFENINQRVYKWIEKGIIDETKNLIKSGVSKKRIQQIGLQYAVILEYLDNKISKGELMEKMQTKVTQYAKRQITWFKKEENIVWFDITSKDYFDKVEKLISAWYHEGTNDAEN